MADNIYDLLVVGGGINGAGIARDASGRGLSVLLVEQDDLASHTSRWSSKLIHGGLRYLEYYEFRLVREALIEREILLRAAPHIIRPLTFVLPHSPEQRPAWLVRLGLLLYDHLGGREILPASRAIDLGAPGPYGDPLQDWLGRGFTYSDCWVDDARLVVLNAIDARERGAEILTRTHCRRATRLAGHWEAELAANGPGGTDARVRARALVNAAGPWVSSFLEQGLGLHRRAHVKLVRGSHIVVPRLHAGEHAYILQNTDKRIVFVIPYEQEFSLIGTTDVVHEGPPGDPAVTAQEIDYLCAVVNRYLDRQVSAADIVWSYAGVRPLYDDASENASAVTRDYVFDVDAGDDRAPLLSIFGGKITTYRKLAEHALAKLQPVIGFTAKPWTAAATLPGGGIADADFDGFLAGLGTRSPWLPEALRRRWARAYGTRCDGLIGGATDLAGLGPELGGIHVAELDHLRREEFARCADDVLWRRSKLGLHLPPGSAAAIDAWFAAAAEVGPSPLAERRAMV